MLAPCAAIVLIGIGLSLMNFGVDEIANPRMRTLGNVAKAPVHYTHLTLPTSDLVTRSIDDGALEKKTTYTQRYGAS